MTPSTSNMNGSLPSASKKKVKKICINFRVRGREAYLSGYYVASLLSESKSNQVWVEFPLRVCKVASFLFTTQIFASDFSSASKVSLTHTRLFVRIWASGLGLDCTSACVCARMTMVPCAMNNSFVEDSNPFRWFPYWIRASIELGHETRQAWVDRVRPIELKIIVNVRKCTVSRFD